MRGSIAIVISMVNSGIVAGIVDWLGSHAHAKMKASSSKDWFGTIGQTPRFLSMLFIDGGIV
jgi:hypothetical protein